MAATALIVVGCGGSGSSTARSASGASNPLNSYELYVDPQNHGQTHGTPKEREVIGSQPSALWFGKDPYLEADIAEYVQSVAAFGKLPVLVAYNIPDRDCGGSSAGGAASPAAYRAWIRRFAVGMSNNDPVVIILEPDALAQTIQACHSTDANAHLSLLAYAVGKLKRASNAYVYIDAGNAGWIDDPSQLANALKQAGVAEADGFALNVANYETTSRSIRYGTAVSKRLGGKHFVIDTSRNGAGPTPVNDGKPWCNQPGQKLGDSPTTRTNQPLVDAYLWVKQPGDSDGVCHGISQPAGVWSPKLASQLTGS
ncbi:glycoside hydrolase family 6 protein [Candidatus Saccharibacteria bacterium]|nr:glycoside hydrolase family 6 protein [Candidatus Saccharibacteria bacterium]